MIKRSICLLLVLLAVPTAARALILRDLPPRQISDLDTLRARLAEAREDFRDLAMDSLLIGLLGRRPGDGFALREVAARAQDRMEIVASLHSLDQGGSGPVPSEVRLEEADRALLRGVLEYYRGRLTSARVHLERARSLRPGWSWAHYYLGRVAMDALAPLRDYEAHYQEALKDPEIVPVVLEVVGRSTTLGFPEAGEARRLLREGHAAPYSEGNLAIWEAEPELDHGRMTPARAESLWRSTSSSLSFGRGDCAAHFGYQLSNALAPPEYAAFLDRREREPGGQAREWAYCRAGLWWLLGNLGRAESLVARLAKPTPRELEFLVAIGHFRDPAPLLRSRIERLWSEQCSADSYRRMRDLWNDLGQAERAAAYLDTLRSENPAGWAEIRLEALMRTDPGAARALLDSLRAAGASESALADERMVVAEQIGDTLSLDELEKAGPRWRTVAWAGRMADAALARGDLARFRRLSRFAVSLRPSGLWTLNARLEAAHRAEDRELMADLVARIDSVCPDCPAAWPSTLSALRRLDRTEDALSRMQRGVRQVDLPPESAAYLVFAADAFALPTVADSGLHLALTADPESRSVRYAQAWLLVRKNKMEEARAILEPLVREFPGREAYRSLFMAAGGEAPPTSETSPDQDIAQAFDSLDYELTGVGAIRALRVPPDSFPGADAVVLTERLSCVASGLDRCLLRNRLTVQILKETALERYQPIRIGFVPSEGVPQIRVARVVHPDGQVTEVPRSDVITTAREEQSTDVSDARALVIPFPGLQVGSILDLVYDRPDQSPFSRGWSFRYFPGDAVPVIESVLDLKLLRGLTVAIHQGQGMEPPAVRTEGPWEIRQWRRTHLDAIDLETNSPGVYAIYPWVAVSAYPSWAEIVDSYRESFYTRAAPSDSIRSLVKELTRGVTGDDAKVQRIFSYVVGQVKYLAIELGRGRIIPTPASEVLRRGYGDCKDMTALLVSLLQAAGIDAAPALLSTRSDLQPLADLPEPEIFNHLVASVPGAGGRIFCDATTQDSCSVGRRVGLGGLLALPIPRDGPGALERIPADRGADHGFNTEVDIRPRSDRIADFDVTMNYRGSVATFVRGWLSQPDTAETSAFVRKHLLPGIWNSTIRGSWRQERDDCAGLLLRGTYQDTAWAEGQHDVRMRFPTEVANPFLRYPERKDRTQAVRLPFPFSCSAVIRFHDSAGWETSREIPEVSVKGSGYEGSLTKTLRSSGDDHWVEVQESFTLDRIDFSPEEYQQFHRDLIRFMVSVYQAFDFRQVLEEAQLKKIESWVADHPDDYGFALDAASRLLGSDRGGEGKAGQTRRTIARRLLGPLGRDAETGYMPLVFLAGIEQEEGHYRIADSLVSQAIQRSPGEWLPKLFKVHLAQELAKDDEEIDALRSVIRMTGGSGLDLDLISALYAAGREAEGREGEERYYALHSGITDTTGVLAARLQGYQRARDCERATLALAALKPRLDPDQLDQMQHNLAMTCDKYAEALPVLERLWDENPMEPSICNNLAWVYALLGQKLERAEELVQSAIILSSDPAASKNTLGAIYARRGQWERARALFEELRNSDDRPSTILVNDYFVALCDYELGRKDAALARWNAVVQSGQGVRAESDWVDRARQSLDRAARNEDVTKVIFTE